MDEYIVQTKAGRIRGFKANEMIQYLGIPYAEAPIGKLRFKRAVPHAKWDGVLDTRAYGPVSVQIEDGILKGSEDCLTLNVQRPLTGDRLPVLVWIHGGGYNTGSADCSMTDGASFVENGICYVSIQYRLNVLGFYDFTTYEGCEDFDSNCGLSDQILALTWVHENIAAFGGDPEKVTIMGESAGAASCVNMLAAPAVKGFFQQAILESALPNCVMDHKMSRENLDLFIEGMGWTKDDLGLLKTIDAAELQKGNSYVALKQQYKNPGMFLPGPVIDDLLPEYPLDAIMNGSAEGIRILIGTNMHEGTMFVRPEGTVFPNSWEMVEEMLTKNGYAKEYADFRAYYERFGQDAFVAFGTDYAFQWAGTRLALSQSSHDDVYMYRYELVTKSGMESGMRASHAFEMPAVFADRDFAFSKFVFDGEDDELIEKITDNMHRSWVNFVKEGNPGLGWERFCKEKQSVRIFDKEIKDKVLDRTKMLNLWDSKTFYR